MYNNNYIIYNKNNSDISFQFPPIHTQNALGSTYANTLNHSLSTTQVSQTKFERQHLEMLFMYFLFSHLVRYFLMMLGFWNKKCGSYGLDVCLQKRLKSLFHSQTVLAAEECRRCTWRGGLAIGSTGRIPGGLAANLAHCPTYFCCCCFCCLPNVATKVIISEFAVNNINKNNNY